MNKSLPGIIALIGALCLGLGAYMAFNQTTPVVPTQTLTQTNPLDMSADFGIVKETVFQKSTKIAFSSPQEFFDYTGKTSWNGLIFDRLQQLPVGLHFVDGRPLGPDDYKRAMGGK